MGQSPISLPILVCSVTLCGVLVVLENSAYGASTSNKAEGKRLPTPVAARHSVKPQMTQKGHVSSSQTGMASKNKKPSDRQMRKALRGRKPIQTETVAESMTGLVHHGLLKSPNRYHINRGTRRTVVVTSTSGDLVHDHFLELDKNRDGVIDPLERAVARLDIERDMNNH